jgi:hypothetical protein
VDCRTSLHCRSRNRSRRRSQNRRRRKNGRLFARRLKTPPPIFRQVFAAAADRR